MISLDEFAAVVARCAGVEPARVDGTARLGVDLGLDSYELLELHAAVSDLGVELPEGRWLSVVTVGDLFESYKAGRGGDSRDSMDEESPSGKIFGEHDDGPTGPTAPGAEFPRLVLPVHERGDDRAGADLPTPKPPERVGRFFRLLPIMPGATPFLYELATAADVGFRWRSGARSRGARSSSRSCGTGY